MSQGIIAEAMDFWENYEEKVAVAANFVRTKLGDTTPLFALTLGSGLGDLADCVKNPKVISYSEIPNFPHTTVHGHDGKLIYGSIKGVKVILLKGRKHYYECADLPFNNGSLKSSFPIHVMANLGVMNYFATNAAGGLNLNYQPGDLMIINSHINLIPNPLLGRHHRFTRVDNGNQTERFEPMNDAYDPFLRKLLVKAGAEFKGHIHEGIYLALTGPTYETEAESVAFRDYLGTDAVGMSTAPEVIVARNRGMKCVALSCITNTITQDGSNATSHAEVFATLNSQELRERLILVILNFFRLYGEEQ